MVLLVILLMLFLIVMLQMMMLLLMFFVDGLCGKHVCPFGFEFTVFFPFELTLAVRLL